MGDAIHVLLTQAGTYKGTFRRMEDAQAAGWFTQSVRADGLATMMRRKV